VKRPFRELVDEYYYESLSDSYAESDCQQEDPKFAYHAYNQISSAFLSIKRGRKAKDKDMDGLEYDRYVKSFDERLRVKNPLTWWRQHESGLS
jgi:hypothetical protein